MSHISQFTSRFLATKCYKWIPHSPEEFSHLQFWGLYLPVTVESLIKTVAQQNQHMFDWQRGTILHLSNSACSRDCNAGVSNPCVAFPGSISIPGRLKWANGKGFIIQNCHKTAQIAIHWELPPHYPARFLKRKLKDESFTTVTGWVQTSSHTLRLQHGSSMPTILLRSKNLAEL